MNWLRTRVSFWPFTNGACIVEFTDNLPSLVGPQFVNLASFGLLGDATTLQVYLSLNPLAISYEESGPSLVIRQVL